MKKFLVTFLFLFSFTFTAYAQEFDVTSHHVILYNMLDDTEIYEENSNERVSIASLTKIMTTIVALENISDYEQVVTIKDEDFVGTIGYSEAGFKTGDKATIMDLLYGIMLPSGADAVNAVVRVTAGSEEKFVKLMNEKAKEIGLTNTSFANPVGRDDEDNYSTAYDVAKLLKYALKNETFKKIFTTKYYKVPSNGLELKSTLSAYKMLDTSIIMGSKSGFTKNAGRCLASISEINGIDYLLVVIKSDLSKNYNAVQDTLTIYDYYSSNYSYQIILNKNNVIESLPIKLGKDETYEVKVNENVSKYLKNDVSSYLVYKYDGINEITENIKVGEKIGEVGVYYEEELLYTADVFLNTELSFYHPMLYIIIIIAVIILFFLIKIIFGKKKRRKRRR